MKYPERFAAAGGRRRSPCGERGLKWGRAAAADAQGWSLPVRGAWIEIGRSARSWRKRCTSLPVRGAWIEMRRKKLLLVRYRGRSPCGERGLKSTKKTLASLLASSLPVRGAWIEMAAATARCRTARRRSPCGERGLKFIRAVAAPAALHVAPRAGSVD